MPPFTRRLTASAPTSSNTIALCELKTHCARGWSVSTADLAWPQHYLLKMVASFVYRSVARRRRASWLQIATTGNADNYSGGSPTATATA